jgi:hypothetical protein
MFPTFDLEVQNRLAVAIAAGIAIPILVFLAYLGWRRVIRRDLPSWRNGAGLASLFIVFALWLIHTIRWTILSGNHEFLSANWREVETFLPAFYAYPALPLAFALKGIPRLRMVGAWFLLTLFNGAFTYT